MKFKDYISSVQVFTVDDLRSNLDSEGSLKTSLARASRSGEIERVRKGLYVSKTGKFVDENADSRLIASTLDSDAVFVYHSALDLHGVAHNVSFHVSFRSEVVVTDFNYDGVSYIRYPGDGSAAVQQLHAKTYGSVNVTTREQTIIDCLQHPGRAGGIEEVIRSLSAFPYIDIAQLDKLLAGVSLSLQARIGWLLEANQENWHVDTSFLQQLRLRLGSGPYRMDNKSSKSQGWVQRWRLCLPKAPEEVLSWVQ
jgi:predicted transcriptional regulator of viral defense system